jgi:hypothetical protein
LGFLESDIRGGKPLFVGIQGVIDLFKVGIALAAPLLHTGLKGP